MFIVMELVEGETLAARAARGPMAPERVIGSRVSCARARARARARHRASRSQAGQHPLVAPGAAAERARISDFGLAHHAR